MYELALRNYSNKGEHSAANSDMYSAPKSDQEQE